MLAAAFSVTVVADSSDAAVIGDIEEPALPADLAEGSVICTVDGDGFTDFAAAITAATESNKPIILNNNYNCTIETIDFTGDLEINLNGHTLAVNLIELTGEESITISNGSLLGKSVDDFLHSTITARGNASITLDDVDYYTEATGAIAYDNSSITVRNGTVIHAIGFGLGTNAGDPLGYDVKVTVTDSAVYADPDPTKAGTAILFNVPGLLTITDSTIQGYYQGVIVRGGNAVISGSTITNTLGERVTVDNYESKDWGTGNAVPTSALVIGNKTASAYQYPTSVSITDTEVVTDGAKAGQASTVIVNANDGDDLGVDFAYDEQSSFTNTGKTNIASDITYDTSDDNIAVGNPVAKIGDRGFASLQAAVAAVPTDGTETTIVLVDDVSLSITDGVSDGNIIIPSGDNIILDLNGHDITVESSASNDNQYVFSVEGTLTIMDDSTADVGKITSRGVNVKESGHLILKSGTIDSIDSTGSAVRVEGKFDMTGGTLMVSKDGSDNPCLDTRDNGTSNVTGGTFDPSKWTIRNLGTLNISGVTLTSDTTNWNSIKVFTGNVTIENCTFDLSLGGGVEVTSASGYPAPDVTISNSEFTQSQLSGTQSWNSMCVAVSGGSSVTVNDCTFNTVAYGFYVFSSGGSIEVNGGTYNATGDKPLFQVDADTSSYPDAVSSAVVNGGTFNGTLPTELGERESLTIYGGRFLDKDGNLNNAATHYVAEGYTIDTETGYVVLADDVPCVAKIGDREFPSLAEALNNVNSGQTIVLQADTTESIIISSGLSITLDLNRHTITNTDGSHTITNKGTLTIIDSVGGGTVDNVSHGRAAVFNDVGGTTYLNGGTYTRSDEAGTYVPYSDNGNSYYVLENRGTMYIGVQSASNENSVTVEAKGGYSSLIHNGWQNSGDNKGQTNATLTIYSGSFSGGVNTVKNDEWGSLTIENGSFENVYQQSVLNWNVATINGGTFDGPQCSIRTESYVSSSVGSLTVNGGKFLGAVGIISAAEGTANVTNGDFTACTTPLSSIGSGSFSVEGGSYSVQIDEDYLANGYVLEGTDGNYGVGKANKVTFDVNVSGATISVTSTDGSIVYNPEDDGSYLLASGQYRVVVNAEGYQTWDKTVTISGEGAIEITLSVEQTPGTIYESGQIVTVTATDGEITVPVNGGPHSNVTLTVRFGGDSVTVNGTVTDDVIISYAYLNAQGSDLAFDLSIDGVSDTDMTVTIRIPVELGDDEIIDPDSVYVYSVVGGVQTPETAYASGSDIVIVTNHNTPFYVSYDVMTLDTPVYPPIFPGGDDDDVVIPPTVVVDQGSSDDDEAVKIAACAAAAVAAAVLAVLAIALYRKD